MTEHSGEEVTLTEVERDAIRDAFDARGHDYTLLYPVVEKVVIDRVTGVLHRFRSIHTGADMTGDGVRRIFMDPVQLGDFVTWLESWVTRPEGSDR